MKKLLTVLLVLASPALADDDELPQFPKIAPPSPLPEAACEGVADAQHWGLGDWVGPSLRIHVEATGWTISGDVGKSGGTSQLEPCGLSLNDQSGPVFTAVRAEDGRMLAAYWTDAGKAKRFTLHRP